MSGVVIEVEDLRKAYGPVQAVDRISFSVAEGEIFGFVGPNGAGKTTTIECVEGLRRPDQGTIRVLGIDPHRDPYRLRPLVGMQLQQSEVPDLLRVHEVIGVFSALYPRSVNGDALLARVGLEHRRRARVGRLSGGEKQRLFIALALVSDPKVVFLDELTTGLDPHARRQMWNEVRRLREDGRTIVLSTHFMEEAERLCDRVAIVDRGRIVALDSPQDLIHRFGGGRRLVVEVAPEADVSGAVHALQALPEVAGVEHRGHELVVTGRERTLALRAVALLAEQHVPVVDVRTEQPTLDDIFVALTGRPMETEVSDARGVSEHGERSRGVAG
ncbi:ABC transporter ATP-binding protein [Limnochorda pilosa]|uniref:Sulfate ABC transporter ATPase n=1 Tax=Limnochorda pilosa TaxID=1555112 RepID=A0A0K2SH47_LIMPI|nr:ABC transporter ATP-binding protein [Limnochorda pilosa]BAS26357.1 sulfate ABC transporter ATPase [Limnochorda pilosa]